MLELKSEKKRIENVAIIIVEDSQVLDVYQKEEVTSTG